VEFTNSYEQYASERKPFYDRISDYHSQLKRMSMSWYNFNRCILVPDALPTIGIKNLPYKSLKLILSIYCADLVGYRPAMELLEQGANPCHLLFQVALSTTEALAKLITMLYQTDHVLFLNVLKSMESALGRRQPEMQHMLFVALTDLPGGTGTESDIVDYINRIGPPSSPDDWRKHPFVLATHFRNIATMQRLLETSPETVSHEIRYISLFIVVSQEPPDLDLIPVKGWRLDQEGDLDMVNLLLRYDALGSDRALQSMPPQFRYSIIHAAILATENSRNNALAAEILKSIARHVYPLDTLMPWSTGKSTPLFFAISLWKPEAVKTLLDAGARRVDHKDEAIAAKIYLELWESRSWEPELSRHEVSDMIWNAEAAGANLFTTFSPQAHIGADDQKKPLLERISDTAAADDSSGESVESKRSALYIQEQQEKWARIRRNAKERAARLSEGQLPRNQSPSNHTNWAKLEAKVSIEPPSSYQSENS
jgi:hypothetical protein